MAYCSINGYSNKTTCEAAGGEGLLGDNSKEYAYYLEGNRIAIVEKDVNFDNNIDNKDYGPGVTRQKWDSPQRDVSQGIRIKYSYVNFNDIEDETYDLDLILPLYLQNQPWRQSFLLLF